MVSIGESGSAIDQAINNYCLIDCHYITYKCNYIIDTFI